ncbi:hypothetical protein PRUPE_7G041800 [Prunus persica]|uniref:Uncharacterized protein n=1 Tax=Prunus persica TaxID=3760 RepID=A0A251N6H7_PRUPE|nr:hypothetical protein PRUPE_7G041800 [Prunus persica]
MLGNDVREETKRLSSSSNAWRPFTQTKQIEEEDSPSLVEEEDPPSSVEEEDPPSSVEEEDPSSMRQRDEVLLEQDVNPIQDEGLVIHNSTSQLQNGKR